MESFLLENKIPFLYTTIFIKNIIAATTLIDDGSQSYAQISELLAKKLSLPLLNIAPRIFESVIKGPTTVIRHVTRFFLNIGEIKLPRMFAYVVSNQHKKLILGRLWLKNNRITFVAEKNKLYFGRYNFNFYSNQILKKEKFKKLIQIMASTYNELV